MLIEILYFRKTVKKYDFLKDYESKGWTEESKA